MQFSKIAVFVCAFTLMVSAVRAEDNPDQAAARAALVAKLFDISAASATNPVATPSTGSASGAPVFSTTTVVKPAVKVDEAVMHPINQTPAPNYTSAPPIDNGGNFRILRSPRLDIQNPPMTWTKTEAMPVYAPAAKKTSAPPVANKPVANSSSAQTQAVASRPLPPAVAMTPAAGNADGFAPIVAPALPLAAGKQQKLLDLLAKYKADQITPEEYHRQRAAIINGM